jgi:hypothetical protein
MTHNPEIFRQRATAYRNGRDWIREKRDEFIKAANRKVTSQPQDTSFELSDFNEFFISTNRITALKSDISADELAFRR